MQGTDVVCLVLIFEFIELRFVWHKGLNNFILFKENWLLLYFFCKFHNNYILDNTEKGPFSCIMDRLGLQRLPVIIWKRFQDFIERFNEFS